ncbi:hypothetical protein SISNIDRAFT_385705, partial [Sistotremastrum niveocremeum HHB9708]
SSSEPETDDSYYARLLSTEKKWAKYQPWLQSIGYLLRPRYQPGWVPSWRRTKRKVTKCEDHVLPDRKGVVMDATRISDNRTVILKFTPTETQELPIWQFLTSPVLQKDTRNHCVPLLDIHPLPDNDDYAVAVMPLLVLFNYVPLQTMGEVFACLYHLLEGIVFLHKHNVAHLDFCAPNTFMEPGPSLFPKGFHPARLTMRIDSRRRDRVHRLPPFTCRTLSEVRYFFIDFGESVRFASEEKRELISGRVGHYTDIPEFKSNDPYDPFMVDIRAFGEMIKDVILGEYKGVESLEPFVSKLCSDSPTDRPTAAEA